MAGPVTLSLPCATASILLVWVGNPAIGFGPMHDPHKASTFAWAITIALAALASLGAAWVVDRRPFASAIVRGAIALVAAFGAYEAVFLAAKIVLPSGSGAFAPAVVSRIFCINAVALGLLLAVHRLACCRPSRIPHR